MILGYLLNELIVAVEYEDYDRQSQIACQLLPYEAEGLVSDQEIAEIILGA